MSKSIIILASLIFSIGISVGCSKKEEIPTPLPPIEKTLTELKWKVKSVTIDGNKELTPTTNISNSNAYILEFQNDSIFNLNLSLNKAIGRYKIIGEQQITIFGYNGFTQVCCNNNFDEDWLIPTFEVVTTYKREGINLTFTGSKGDIEFEIE